MGIGQVGGDRLGETGSRILCAAEFHQQHAEQRFGHRIVAVENHRLGRVLRRARIVAQLPAQIGPAYAQPGMVRRGCHRRVQLLPRHIEASLVQRQQRGEFRQSW